MSQLILARAESCRIVQDSARFRGWPLYAMSFFKYGKYTGHSFEKVARDDRCYSAWALREEQGGDLSRNLASFVKFVKEKHGGVVGVGKHRGVYFSEVAKTDPEYVEWCASLTNPGMALKELADYAKGEEEDSSKKRKREDQGLKGTCVICLEQPLGACFIPCGHTTTCYTCAVNITDRRCPICREKGRIQKLFVG